MGVNGSKSGARPPKSFITRNETTRTDSEWELKKKTVGKFEYMEEDKIASGSLGNILFRGKLADASGSRMCAINRIPITKKGIEQYCGDKSVELAHAQQEAKIMREFSHDNLITYSDVIFNVSITRMLEKYHKSKDQI